MGLKLITETQTKDILTESKDKDLFIYGVFSSAEVKNNNGRVYKKQILEREIQKVMEKVSNKSLYGELSHPSCFHGRTEALTIDGWKKIEEIEIGEEVYTLNRETKEVEVQKVTNVYKENYKGDMIRLNNRTIDTLVTPNHRFLLEDRYGKLGFKTSNELYEKEYRHHKIPKLSSNVKSYDENTNVKIGDYDIDIIDFCWFLGVYLADGNIYKRKGRENSYKLSVYQNEGEKANKIRQILSRLPFSFTEDEKINGGGNKTITFRCHNNDLCKYVYPMGLHYEKYIPKDLIKQMDEKSAYAFLEGFILGDGRGKLNTKSNRCDVFSTSEQLIDDISHVSFIAGIPTRKHYEDCTEDYVFADRVIKACNKKRLWFIAFLNTKGVYLDRRFMNINIEKDYDDKVYCLTLPNETFYVRDGEYTFWTGNSPEISLERAAILIEDLDWKKNDVYGKAKVLKTPKGEIIRGIIESGGRFGISSRGLGTVSENGYVDESYNLITWDAVGDASNPASEFVNGIYEGKEFNVDGNIELTIEEARKEYTRKLWQVIENIKKSL